MYCTVYTAPNVLNNAERRVRLKKRRKQDVSLQAQRTRLIVRQHDPNDEEVSEREARRSYLMTQELPVEEYKPLEDEAAPEEGAGGDEMKTAEGAEGLEDDEELKPHEQMDEAGDAAEENPDDEFKPNAEG